MFKWNSDVKLLDEIYINERLNPPVKLGRLEEVVAGMRK